MIQRRNQLQNDILSNNLNNPISMLGNNFAMMYNNSNNQYFTNPHQINNGDFRMNMPPNSNFIYVDRPKKSQRNSQQPNGSNQQSQISNPYTNNLNNVININSVINPNPYSNNLNNNIQHNSSTQVNIGSVNGTSVNQQQPKKEEKKTTSNPNLVGGNKKKQDTNTVKLNNTIK